MAREAGDRHAEQAGHASGQPFVTPDRRRNGLDQAQRQPPLTRPRRGSTMSYLSSARTGSAASDRRPPLPRGCGATATATGQKASGTRHVRRTRPPSSGAVCGGHCRRYGVRRYGVRFPPTGQGPGSGRGAVRAQGCLTPHRPGARFQLVAKLSDGYGARDDTNRTRGHRGGMIVT